MVAAFARTYHDEIRHSAGEANARLAQDRKQRAEVDRKIGAIITAIEDGGYSKTLKARLDELEINKSAFELRLAGPASSPIRIHLKRSELYSRKVEQLAASLNDEAIRLEAAEVMRGLIDKIVLTPEGDVLKAELHGDLAHILALTEESTIKANAPAFGRGVKPSVVAGAHNQRYLQLSEAWL
jgi:site-specific DNA recombinase